MNSLRDVLENFAEDVEVLSEITTLRGVEAIDAALRLICAVPIMTTVFPVESADQPAQVARADFALHVQPQGPLFGPNGERRPATPIGFVVSLYGGPDGSAFAKPGAASAAPQVIAFLPLWSLCSSLLPLLQAAGAIQPALEVHRDDEA